MKIVKHIFAFIILVFAVLCSLPALVLLIILACIRETEYKFPRLFKKDIYTEAWKSLVEYFDMKLWQQITVCAVGAFMFYFIFFITISADSKNKEKKIEPKHSNCRTAYGKELEFISWIKRDGSGTTQLQKEKMDHLDDTLFTITCLSITEETYIASEFSSYVVKFKKS